MKSKLVTLAIILLALAFVSCADDPQPTQTPSQTIIQTQNVNIAGPSTGTGSQDCPIVDNLGTSARLGGAEVGQAKVGDVLGLDATPKAGQTPVDASCHASVANWSVSTPITCQLIGNTQGFNPGLLLLAAGQCSVGVNVGGIQGGLSVNVVP